MKGYYFDIETHPHGDIPNPIKDEIITVQYQPIEVRTGKPLGDLIVIKDWDKGFSEKRIVAEAYELLFKDSNPWNFVPVGFNLWFEWRFLNEKFKKYLNKKLGLEKFCMPQIDLKHVAVLMNQGYFKGCGLDTFTNKIGGGIIIKELYENKKYQEIESYIRTEAEEFLKFYRKVLINLTKLGSKIRSHR